MACAGRAAMAITETQFTLLVAYNSHVGNKQIGREDTVLFFLFESESCAEFRLLTETDEEVEIRREKDC